MTTATAVATDLSARDDFKRKTLTAIVELLPAKHRVAFYRFYSENLHSTQAIQGSGLSENTFRELRDEMRRKYHAAIRGPLTPEEWLLREQRLTARLNDIARRRGVTGSEILQVIREREQLFVAGGAQ